MLLVCDFDNSKLDALKNMTFFEYLRELDRKLQEVARRKKQT